MCGRLAKLSKEKLDICVGVGLTSVDYVIRRFNASSAGLNLPVWLDLRWAAAQRNLHFGEAESAISGSFFWVRLLRMVPVLPELTT